MERYAAGDDDAFSDLYDHLAPRLFGYLRRLTGKGDRAEDLLQQTFLHMHAARGRFLPGAEVVPWPFAIARRLVIDGHRRQRRADGVIAPTVANIAEERPGPDGADEIALANETAAQLSEALQRLPESQRVAFELIKQEGLSYAQAASVLGTTETAVKLRAHRAFEALREALGDHPGADP